MEKYFVVAGALLKCSEGVINSPFVSLNLLWDINNNPVGLQTDFIPLFNIFPFGPNCKLLTEAAGGIPVPCVPFPLPWQGTHTSGQSLMLPVLLNSSTCRCSFGGGIEVANPGQNLVSYDGPVAPSPPAPPLPTNIVVYRPGDPYTDTAHQQTHAEELAKAEQMLNRPATLPPNTLFLVNDYLYVTDAHGKVVQAKGVLPPASTGEREEYAQQQSVRYKDGWPNPHYMSDPRTKPQRRKPEFAAPNPQYLEDKRTKEQKSKSSPIYEKDKRTKEQRRKPKKGGGVLNL